MVPPADVAIDQLAPRVEPPSQEKRVEKTKENIFTEHLKTEPLSDKDAMESADNSCTLCVPSWVADFSKRNLARECIMRVELTAGSFVCRLTCYLPSFGVSAYHWNTDQRRSWT